MSQMLGPGLGANRANTSTVRAQHSHGVWPVHAPDLKHKVLLQLYPVARELAGSHRYALSTQVSFFRVMHERFGWCVCEGLKGLCHPAIIPKRGHNDRGKDLLNSFIIEFEVGEVQTLVVGSHLAKTRNPVFLSSSLFPR